MVLDLMMPQMTGASFLRTIRQDARLREVPVLVLSAVYGMGTSLKNLDASGAISKPFDVDELLDMVDRLSTGAHRPLDANSEA